MQELIKNPMILRYGYRYEIKKTSSVRYRYAEPTEYAGNTYIGECWIVDIAGNVDPKNADSPILFSAKDLKNGVLRELRGSQSISLVLREGDDNEDESKKGDDNENGSKMEKGIKKATREDRRRRRREQQTS